MASNAGATLKRKLDAIAREVERAERAATTRGATVLKQAVEKRLPASKRLRGVGKSGSKIGVRYDIKADGKAEVKATGKGFQILERDTKAHTVQPKRARARKQTGRGGGVRLADGSVRRAVKHPGTKGQHPFEKGIEAGTPAAVKAIRDMTMPAIKKGLTS